MKKKNPLVSIIIPVYNVEQYIFKCLESVEKQTYSNFEVIIVNDESKDDSILIAQEFVSNDDRFKIIHQKNKGLGGARNTGILNAKGQYLFLLDSDDYIRKETLDVTIEYALSKSLDIVVFNYEKIEPDGTILAAPKFGEGVFSKEAAFRNILSLKTSPQAWNKLYKKDLFIKNDILYPEHFLHEDLPVTYKLFWNADKIGYLNNSYYYWLARENSITQKFTYKHINDISEALLSIKNYLNDNAIFEKYKDEYFRGSLQMLNLLLERSFNFSLHVSSKALVDYALYIVELGLIIDKEQIKRVETYDRKLYLKYINNYSQCQNYLQEGNFIDTEGYLLKKIKILEDKLFNIYNSRAYKVIKLYYFIRDIIFPEGSIRKKILKKIIRKL